MTAEQEDNQFIEGFNAAGKSLDRIQTMKDLHEIHMKTNQAKTEVDTILAQEMDKLQKLQNELGQVNEEFNRKQLELSKLEKQQVVDLDPGRKMHLAELMKGKLGDYLEVRPTGENDKRSVHVYFLTGEEVGSELHVGREGAGSRDATFIVSLSQTVQSLATQAAKYWGLDSDKVFFLDRDGRIVQGSMHLSDIILPPLAPEAVAAQEAAAQQQAVGQLQLGMGGQGSTAIVPATSQLAKQAETHNQNQITSYTVKGRDYNLTLVRAKTVLDKEDLSVPKGEKWNDFTFDPKKLNEDLEITRKKRGDPDPQAAQIGMDSIPSLHTLIEAGNRRKFEKNADKWCRICELIVFLVMWFLFTLLLKPDGTWRTSMQMAGNAIRSDVITFNLAEQENTGIHNFTEIVYPYQLMQWFKGPLKRSVLPGGLDEKRNIFPLKLQVRMFDTAEVESIDGIKWCDDDGGNSTNGSQAESTDTATAAEGTTVAGTTTEGPSGGDGANASNSSDGKCYPSSLKGCPSKAVVEMLDYAITQGQQVPICKQMYHSNIFVSIWRRLASVDAFSFAEGDISTYMGGHPYAINLTSSENYDNSVTEILPQADGVHEAAILRPVPAMLTNVFSFLPTQGAIHVLQLLAEFSPSGPVFTSEKQYSIRLDTTDEFENIIILVTLVLAILVLILELRRITGFPQRYFWENRKQPCGCYLAFYIILPILLLLGYWIILMKMTKFDLEDPKAFDPLRLSDHSLEPDDPALALDTTIPVEFMKIHPFAWRTSEKELFDIQAQVFNDYTQLWLQLMIFLVMFVLSFRYFLVFFPELRYISVMISKAIAPVVICASLLACAMFSFTVLFYVMFNEQQFEFRSWTSTAMAVLKFAHGGFTRWQEIWFDYKYSWFFLMVGSFIVFTLMLNNILIAVLVSMKKEAELHKNYSSHPFWQQLHRQHMQMASQGRHVGQLNPALAGWDFSEFDGKDGLPKDPKDAGTQGWKV